MTPFEIFEGQMKVINEGISSPETPQDDCLEKGHGFCPACFDEEE